MKRNEDPCRDPASEAWDAWADLEGPGPADEERKANAKAISALPVHERFTLMFRGPQPDPESR